MATSSLHDNQVHEPPQTVSQNITEQVCVENYNDDACPSCRVSYRQLGGRGKQVY